MEFVGRVFLTLFTAAMTIWANNALYYSPMLPHAWRTFRGGELFREYRSRVLVASASGFHHARCGAGFVILVVLFFRISPSKPRWQPDRSGADAVCDDDGDRVTIHNVRRACQCRKVEQKRSATNQTDKKGE
jgi:hypothetical protein